MPGSSLPNVREVNCSGHRQTVGSAHRLRKALNRHNFIPGPCGVCRTDPQIATSPMFTDRIALLAASN